MFMDQLRNGHHPLDFETILAYNSFPLESNRRFVRACEGGIRDAFQPLSHSPLLRCREGIIEDEIMSTSEPALLPGKTLYAFAAGFLKEQGLPPPPESDVAAVPADGSQRLFFRFRAREGNRSIIAMENPPATPFARRENAAYLQIGRHLKARGAPVPEIHRWDLARGWFIVEDLGDTRLQDAAANPETVGPLYERVLQGLFRMQTQGARGFDTAWCCQTERYDRGLMRQYESDYFREAFLGRYLGWTGPKSELDRAFDHLAARASRAGAGFFLHRDFQSRNILVTDDRIGFVDWQGGRLGPLGYDLASLLNDPYVHLSPPERKRLYWIYLDLLRDLDPSWCDPFEETYPYLALQRNLQILGAFAFLSVVREKPFFETHIPSAIHTLEAGLSRLGDPKLRPLSILIKSLPRPWNAS
jgi:aminoglycoside/choline kinase family phosphotransferase